MSYDTNDWRMKEKYIEFHQNFKIFNASKDFLRKWIQPAEWKKIFVIHDIYLKGNCIWNI